VGSPIMAHARCDAVEKAWSPPAERKGQRSSQVPRRAMQDHGATVGPQRLGRVQKPAAKTAGNLPDGVMARRDARFGWSAKRNAVVPSSRQSVPAAICLRGRISWGGSRGAGRPHTLTRTHADAEQHSSGRRRVRVASPVGRDSAWLAGPGLLQACPQVNEYSWVVPSCCEMKVAFCPAAMTAALSSVCARSF
jgi:hypothetical protein